MVMTVYSKSSMLMIFSLVLLMGCTPKFSNTKGLYSALNDFDHGKVEMALGHLKRDMETFSKYEKIQAYKIITIGYIYLNDESRAEDAMLNFLRLNRKYEPDPQVDLPEFIYLYHQYRATSFWPLPVKKKREQQIVRSREK